MYKRTFFDLNSGEVLQVIHGSGQMPNINQLPNTGYINEVVDAMTEYVDPVKLKKGKRPRFNVAINTRRITADNTEVCNLSDIPNGTSIKVYSDTAVVQEETITNGTFNFITDIVGRYTIVLTLFPYNRKRFKIKAI